MEMGRNFCQHRIINLSYRYRGNLDRISRKRKKKKKEEKRRVFGKNSSEVNNLKNNTIPYSPTKIRANSPLEYSVLNPETSSDSPSEKSKGARLHSATQERNQIIRMGKVIKIKEDEKSFLNSKNEKKLFNNKTQKIIKDKEISYEIDWEILRTLPSILNLELDLQPDNNLL